MIKKQVLSKITKLRIIKITIIEINNNLMIILEIKKIILKNLNKLVFSVIIINITTIIIIIRIFKIKKSEINRIMKKKNTKNLILTRRITKMKIIIF